MSKNINYSTQYLDTGDRKEIIKSTFLKNITTGEYVIKFENKLKSFFGNSNTIVCSSGTSALELLISSHGIKKNDIILVPVVNFVSLTNVLRRVGAKIFYCDVDYKSGQVTPNDIYNCIKKNKLKKIKAFFTMQLGGSSYDTEEFYKIKKKYKCYYFEDACHAFGSKYKFRKKIFKVGCCKHVDASTFSFHPLKSITTGEGGAVTFKNKEKYLASKINRSHGILRSKYSWRYDVIDLGHNYRLSDLNCALGFSQIKKISKFLKARRVIAKFYINQFKYIGNIKLCEKYNPLSSYHLFRVIIDFKKIKKTKNNLFNFFKKNGFDLQHHYIPLYFFKSYKLIKKKNFPNSLKYFESTISLPVFFKFKKKEAEKVINLLKTFLSN